ncbi:Hypoxanthine phosphoribosyltransferase [subsurface metagenome]
MNHEQIRDVVDRLAEEIRRDYKQKTPVLVGILKGSFVFMADLIRALDMPLEVDFVILSSYGSGTESSGKIKVIHGLESSIEGKDVLIVEDIIDSGLTLSLFLEELRRRKPASLRLCVLVDKVARRKLNVLIDYIGVQVQDEFVVGYGIDYDEQYRYLPDLYVVED